MPRMYPAYGPPANRCPAAIRRSRSLRSRPRPGICQPTLVSVEAPSVDRRRRYRGRPECGSRRAGRGP